MTVFWWIAGLALALAAGATALFFLLYIMRGDDRFLELAKAGRHWVIVIALFSFNVGIFKHVVLTLWSMWRV